MADSSMDSVLAYRNFLAAEDHLCELVFNATSSDGQQQLMSMLETTISLRDDVMPAEADPTKHCLVKHYSIAYEACREVWKASLTEKTYWNMKQAYDLLVEALELLWKRKIAVCERCITKPKEEDGSTGSDGEDLEGGAGHGQPRDLIQTASLS